MENKKAPRTKNSMYNILFSLANSCGAGILRFILRTIFIKYLGETVLGINGLFTNVLSILSLTELGVGTAISFSLYKPLADNDTKKIAGLMNFYKKAYRWIAISVLIIGIALLPFMSYLIKDYDSVKAEMKAIDVIYILFLLNTVITYLMAYKRTLIIADQKEYKIAPIVLLFNVIVTIAQIITLILTKNFVLYLVVQLIVKVIENIFVNRYIDKKYDDVMSLDKEKIDEQDKKSLFSNIKAMFTHKIGDICVYSTDNLIISKFINIATVGIYSNYLMITTLIKSLLVMFFSNLTASLGNLVVTESDEKKKEVFEVMDFVGYVLYGFFSLLLLGIATPFIKIWIGEKYLLSTAVLMLIVVEFFLYGLRIATSTIKSSAGLYKPDRYIGLISAVINLVVSIALVKPFGLAGVIFGTIISAISMPIWYRPYLVYKHIIHTSVKPYYSEYVKRVLLFAIQIVITWFLTIRIQISVSTWVQLIYSAVVSAIIFVLPVILFYRKTKEYIKLKEIVVNLKNKVFKKKIKE